VLERDVARAKRNVNRRVTSGSAAMAEPELAAEVMGSGRTKPESPMMMPFLPGHEHRVQPHADEEDDVHEAERRQSPRCSAPARPAARTPRPDSTKHGRGRAKDDAALKHTDFFSRKMMNHIELNVAFQPMQSKNRWRTCHDLGLFSEIDVAGNHCTVWILH
jgi:hypothetical protein